MNLILIDRPLSLPASAANSCQLVDLSSKKIAPCVGCFGCWVKTPGRCVIRDDATAIYPLIAQSQRILYVTRVRFGSYDLPMKRMLERSIPIQQAFLRLHHGEVHHVQRNVQPKEAVLIAYDTGSEEERALFTRLVQRNALNMSFVSHRIEFVSAEQVENAVLKEVTAWQTI